MLRENSLEYAYLLNRCGDVTHTFYLYFIHSKCTSFAARMIEAVHISTYSLMSPSFGRSKLMPTNSPAAFRTGDPELPPTVSQEYRKFTGVANNELLPVALALERSSKSLPSKKARGSKEQKKCTEN
jgi:hypothetical protein